MKKFFGGIVLAFIFASAFYAYTEYNKHKKEEYNSGCVKYCGDGYFYDRKGGANDGDELVCTKYPLKCGYDCTGGWNIRYLVDGTNYTCQEAEQDPAYSKSAPSDPLEVYEYRTKNYEDFKQLLIEIGEVKDNPASDRSE